ncbi:DUF2974 domain-containing protein [Dubosiella newyorkensis]|uniref:DUF2974 domain-containing protein n=1 Tax=Dubosiella newyorkensis TaxID=1862672 RepID=UPI00272EAC63|nr:DUF2974 domain-containing protein [Dubosiella newyorkensis]
MNWTIVDYAQNVLQTFDELPFNQVDSLILSCMAYVRMPSSSLPALEGWDGVPFKEVLRAEDFSSMFHTVYSAPHSKDLLCAMCASPRYRDILIKGYTHQNDMKSSMQFSAITFQLNKNMAYIAYRGTDATVIGWKEDFNMAFQYPIASQEESARYLQEAASYVSGQLYVGGHSKGGNLAVYASMHVPSSIQERIVQIDSLDGPGFPQAVLESSSFKHIQAKVHKTLPQSSLIGMLLEQQEDFKIVKSFRFSVWQHDPYSWEVEGYDFATISHLTPGAKYMNRTINAWLNEITPEERERFILALSKILASDKAITSREFRNQIPKNLPAFFQAASDLDEDTKHFLKNTLKEMATLSIKNLHNHPKKEGA